MWNVSNDNSAAKSPAKDNLIKHDFNKMKKLVSGCWFRVVNTSACLTLFEQIDDIANVGLDFLNTNVLM